MTTKKKGKDDDQIREDQERALQARKDARRKSAPPTKKPPTSKKKSSIQRNRKPIDEDSDLDGFIVDDDDDEMDEYSGESESDEEALSRKQKKTTKDEPLDLTSSDDEGEHVPRKPRKTAKNKAFQLSSSKKQNDVPRKPRETTKDEPIELSSNDEGTFLGNFPKRTSRPPAFMSSKGKRTALRDSSNRFAEEKKQDFSSSSSEEELQVSRLFDKGKKSKESLFQIAKASSDDESESDVTPFKPGRQKAEAPGTTKTIFLDDSSGDEIPVKPKRSRAMDLDDDDAMDSDEAAAVAFALKESQKPAAKRKRLKNNKLEKKKKKKSRVVVALSDGEDVVSENDVEAILEESSSGEEEEQDAYQDEDAKEAGSVLQAANTLSAKVLQTMVGWQEADAASGTVPTGIIVDGALSVVQCGNNASHSWISQELMQTICPEVKLADYQLVGVNWLALLHGLTCDVDGKKGANVNGVLADEMGLGKTVQTITFLAWLRYHNRKAEGNPPVIALDDDSAGDTNVVSLIDSPAPSSNRPRPHIIIVPASVLSNWEREFEKFCPDMNIIKYHGSMAEREDIKDTMRKYLPRKDGGPVAHPPLDVVLTTFSYFSSEKTDDRNFLRKFHFDYMVVDEAHCLKNPRGLRYRNLDKFETSHRLLLTGTPVQNSPKELMSLLCFLMPLFSKSKGGNEFDGDEDTKNDGGASMLQHFVSLESSNVSTGDDANEAAYRNLKQLFAPFVLRRKKIDVLSQIMPPKVSLEARYVFSLIYRKVVRSPKSSSFSQ
jgi:SNF2 family DNA or RNA helicase